MSAHMDDETRLRENARLRTLSGSIDINSKLTSFLYELMRDYLPVGTVESIVRNSTDPDVKYTNGWLALYAANLAQRLTDTPQVADQASSSSPSI